MKRHFGRAVRKFDAARSATLALVVLGFGVAPLAVAQEPAEAAPASPCAIAEAWLENGFLKEARQAYATVLAQAPAAPCGLEGLGKLVAANREHAFRLAELYRQSGDTEKARAALVGALEAAQLDADATKSVAHFHGEIAREEVDALINAGRYAEAYAKAVARPGLSDEKVGSSWGVAWAATRMFLVTWSQYLLEAVAVVIAAAFLVVFLLRRAREPVLSIETFDADGLSARIGPAFANAVQAALASLASDRSGSLEMRVDQPLYAQSIPAEVVQALPASVSWVQAIPALLGRALTRRTLRVSGTLYSTSERAGATVRIVAGSKMKECASFRSTRAGKATADDDPVKDGAFFNLAEDVAIWILFTLRANDAEFKPLGTSDWRAYHAFVQGVRSTGDEAKAHYVQALQYDGDFHAARYNLALLASRTFYETTIPDLRRACGAKIKHDPMTHFQARYTLAVRLFVLGELEEATRIAQRLVARVNRMSRISLDPALRSYVAYLKPFATALAIGLEIKHTTKLVRVGELDTIRSSAVTPRTNLNLAAAYSLAAEVAYNAGNKAEAAKLICSCLLCLDRALFMNRAVVGDAARNPALSFACTSPLPIDGASASARFAAVVAKYAGPAPSRPASPLAELVAIGPVRAAQLEKEGITTLDSLILRCRTARDREALAAKLEIGSEAVKRWATTAELLTLVGVGIAEANLLNAAQIFGLADLAAGSPEALTLRLGDEAKTLAEPSPPTLANVQGWIVDAAGLPSKIGT